MTIALPRPTSRTLSLRPAKAGAASLRLGVGMLASVLVGSLAVRAPLGNPNAQDLRNAGRPPFSPGFPLGTDTLGRNLLAWCSAGVMTSLLIGVVVVLLSALVGAIVGSSQAMPVAGRRLS